jgi:hypothetical protein
MSIGVASSQQTFPESTYSLRNPLIFSLRAPGTTIGETLESGGGVDEKGIIHWMKSRHPLDDRPRGRLSVCFSLCPNKRTPIEKLSKTQNGGEI